MKPPRHWIPLFASMRHAGRAGLAADVIAGMVTSILLVPQGVAFALLAGLPPQAGLYAAVVGPIAYALFGSSRILSVGPVSVAAIMVAGALASTSLTSSQSVNATVLAIECAAIFFVLAALRLGWIVSLLSHPVLTGFTAGVAMLIIFSQIPPLAGFSGPRELGGWQGYWAIIQGLSGLQWPTLLTGLTSMIALLALGAPFSRWLARRPLSPVVRILLGKSVPLAVIGLAIFWVYLFDWRQQVAQVGTIAAGLPHADFSFLQSADWLPLLPAALAISLIGYVESIAIAKSLASRRREIILPNHELFALGAANAAAGVFGAMPVAGGFSRTMVNAAAGARTQLASVISALLVAAALVFLAPLFAYIPKTTLAAIIIVAVAPLVDWRQLKSIWHFDHGDGWVFLMTAAAVIFSGVETGLILGVATSIAMFLWRAQHTHIAEVGRVAGTEHFRNINRHTVETWPNARFFRIDESLTFANAGKVQDVLMQAVNDDKIVRHVVLLFGAVNHVDSTALEALETFAHDLGNAGITLHLTEIKGPVMDTLRHTAFISGLAPGNIFLHANEAVQALAGSGAA